MAEHQGSRRRAFSLVELLVVIAIIGILVGLMLPAVQMAREAGRRASCQSNLRQWGLAFHHHADVKQVFPWGYHRVTPRGTFVPHLLPYIEQANLDYDLQRDWNDPVNAAAIRQDLAVMTCPSAPGQRRVDPDWPQFLPAAGDYVGTSGVNKSYCETMGWPYYSPEQDNGVMISIECPLEWITDGLSNTFMLQEDAGRPQLWRRGRLVTGTSKNAGWADPDYSIALDGSDTDTSGSGQGQGPCVINCTNDNEAYSFHRGGCLMLMADSSVQLANENIDIHAFAALSTRASGDLIEE